MTEILDSITIILTAVTSWLTDVLQMFFAEPIIIILLIIPLAVYLIFVVIGIVKSIFR